ncbi:ATP-dependent DNA ligase [Roseibium aquae]|uniref:DNA ligase (ATP) n=1 Tax=Roseibium aquae TaxID=1323746 RepID=A0A916TKE6_9HYPH|nr:cisplatin damage response ATP-dependent DNA ligase [Roseibium aquae]GGB48726.1 ATP-dependent DNA ligase [Roseibium aquae]
MLAFAQLLDRLSYEPRRLAKEALLKAYFAEAPDPDRGYALATLTGNLSFKNAKPAMLRTLIADRTDPVLFALSYDFVGDLSETIALMWPSAAVDDTPPAAPPPLRVVVERLASAGKAETPRLLETWLDGLDETGRWALLKLVTGGLRVGVSARLAKTAVARLGGVDPNEVEEVWHGLAPPYEDLFAWVEGRAGKPETTDPVPFRPAMLAHPLDEEKDIGVLPASSFRAEWKWDGIRVQAVCAPAAGGAGHVRRLYTRTGEDISGTFPDILAVLDFHAAIDGELLVKRDGAVRPFGDLQKRLNRKTVGAKLQKDYPAAIRAYDLLALDGVDLRDRPLAERRRMLEDFLAGLGEPRIDLSPQIPAGDWAGWARARKSPATFLPREDAEAVEGLMLKRLDSVYVPGRPKGLWYKWKRDPFLIDAVLMYAQRGHGKRSSFYSDYTFGVWRRGAGGEELVPVGKAYFGFTDEELQQIDRFVRNHTVNRFGPVREVEHTAETGLVLEVAFEGLNRSPRHKSGLAMRFPRISRLRWDKPPSEADWIETLNAFLPSSEA